MDPGVSHIPGGEAGPGSLPLILMLDPAKQARGRSRRVVWMREMPFLGLGIRVHGLSAPLLIRSTLQPVPERHFDGLPGPGARKLRFLA